MSLLNERWMIYDFPAAVAWTLDRFNAIASLSGRRINLKEFVICDRLCVPLRKPLAQNLM